MPPSIVLIALSLLAASCAGLRPIQLQPPFVVPDHLAWGYGVERVSGRPDQSRRKAYVKAVDDLLSRGPLIVSKVVRDSTLVNASSSTRTMESTFRLRASGILQPSFVRNGFEDGFSWVVVGARAEDIERGWQQFLAWREERIEEAALLSEQAEGPDRMGFLEAALQILGEAGAQIEPGLIYHRVRIALEAERSRIAELGTMRQEVVRPLASGRLLAAEGTLARALSFGLPGADYEFLIYRIEDRRGRAASFVRAGDTLYGRRQYKEALQKYEAARILDNDHPGLVGKITEAESSHRMARSQTTRRTLGIIGGTVRGVLGEYFRSKREEEPHEAPDTRPEERAQKETEKVEERKKKDEETAGDTPEKATPGEAEPASDEKKPKTIHPVLIRIPARPDERSEPIRP